MVQRKAKAAREKQRLRVRATLLTEPEKARLQGLAAYECTSPHKEHPRDWGLKPLPSGVNPEKTLCEAAGVTSEAQANALFAEAIAAGMVSEQTDAHDLPKPIWLRTKDGRVFEARAGGSDVGAYHGYPVLEGAPGHSEIISKWSELVCPND